MTESAPKILVADDDADVRDFLQTRLQASGMTVLTADRGDAAWGILSTDADLDLAVLDVVMPGLSGIDVLRKVRAAQSTQDLPVILLTAMSRESDVELGYAVGTTDYMTKPFSPLDLVLRIKATLGLPA